MAVIGRVSPRRASSFLVATKKGGKEAPPAAAPALAGALAAPTPGGSRRNSPWRAQTSTRQFPPATRSSRHCRRGKLLPARLRHCRQVVVPCRQFGLGSRPRFVAPAQAGVQALDPCCFDLGVPSVGGDWPGLAPAGDQLSCGDKKGALVNKSTALGSSGLGGARDAHVLEYIPLAALRPHPICRRSRRFLHKPGAKETPPAGRARRCRRGKLLPARLRHCR